MSTRRVALLLGLCCVQAAVQATWVGPRNGRWPSHEYDRDNKPGSLLLTMLIKNEAANLERSLPLWAQARKNRRLRGYIFSPTVSMIVRLAGGRLLDHRAG